MKNKNIFSILIGLVCVITDNAVAVLFNTLFALTFSMLLGINPIMPIVVWNILAIRFGTAPKVNFLRAGVQKEIWLPFIMENFYPVQSWLTKGRDMSALVDNNKINLAEAGVLPQVLINNNTYPIPVASRTDSPLELPLDTLDTENTIVRNVEAMESSYNKIQSVTNGHQTALRLMSYRRAAHAYAPSANTAKTPVLIATGGDDGTGRKRLTLKDLAKAQTRMEEIDGIDPDVQKTLVLCSKHKEDLILEDLTLFKQFANLKNGTVLNLFNFDISVYNGQAVYNTATGAKKAFGASSAGTDSLATSFFFVDDEVMRADGDYDMFVTYKSPEQRGDIVGFQKRFIALPMRNKGIGAIYSTAV